MSSVRRILPARLVGALASAGRPASPVPMSNAPVASKAIRPVLPVTPCGMPPITVDGAEPSAKCTTRLSVAVVR